MASDAKNRSIYRLVKWLYLLEPINQANFYDYINFINLNPNYPRINRLRYLSEHKINTKTISDNRVIKLFDEKDPFSGYGKLMLGQSYLSKGNREKGISLIKNGWITAKLSKRDLKYLRKKLKKYLNTEDHIKRSDWLAWENKYWDLKRMLRYLPKDYQALYNARLLLMSKSYGVCCLNNKNYEPIFEQNKSNILSLVVSDTFCNACSSCVCPGVAILSSSYFISST